MNLSVPDYKSLYNQQDKVLNLLAGRLGDFYLTGGTALGRFYLGHRYSDDLDFFVNDAPDFIEKTKEFFRIIKFAFRVDESVTLQASGYLRIMISDEIPLKVEFVNDTAYRWGETLMAGSIPVDNPANILANKLTALISRDEPKDVFDIIKISELYSFNWMEIYSHAFNKQLMNEADVAMRLKSFPVELLVKQHWLKYQLKPEDLKTKLETITDDFLFARDNSLGINKLHITKAKPYDRKQDI